METTQLPPLDVLLEGVSTVFESLGRGLICLTPDFRVLRASPGLDRLLGTEIADELTGLPVAQVLGDELFAPGAALRAALEAGEKREGWGGTLAVPGDRPRSVSLSAAPMRHELSSLCDPRVGYLVVVRPAEQVPPGQAGAATVFSGIVARAPSMLAIFRLIDNLSDSEATVLIGGESGTGKEMVARALHARSPRSRGPFVAVNCAALPGDLLESELFGHVRGAFTGAVRDREGRFALASDGTLFLDEIGDLPLPLQVKLLRVLQERTYERVGESRPRRTEARIVAATNTDLRRAVLDGRFRDDLYYRLRVVPIEVPPLRDRREDVEPLARHLLAKVAARHGRSLLLTPQAMRALLAYPWPGNVRELENALEYAVAVCQGQTIQVRDLPGEVAAGGGEPPPLPAAATSPAAERPIAAAAPSAHPGDGERDHLRAALDTHRWQRQQTADALGVSRTTLWRKMREHGLLG